MTRVTLISNPQSNPGFSSRLAWARLAAGHSTIEDAAKAIGMPSDAYEQCEKSDTYPDFEVLCKIAACFGIHPPWLLEGKHSMTGAIETEIFNPYLCRRLAQARKAAGYPTAKSAAAAMGIKYATYSSDEAGRSWPSLQRISLYARFFNLSTRWLYDGILPEEAQYES